MSIHKTDEDIWISKAEACRVLGIDSRALVRLILANRIVCRRLSAGIRETVSLASVRRVQAEAVGTAR